MNVMYGYTAAGWTGRMPCNDIGEAIVQTAASLLKQANIFIESLDKDFQVIYGDTDSIFVQVSNQPFN